MHGLVSDVPGRRLLLGVTREIALATPDLTAVDWSAPMIATVWPGNTEGRRVIESDWMALPLADRSFGVALGDGSLNMLSWPDGYRALATELARVVAPGGRAVIRTFVAPDASESLETVAADALAARIDGFHALKWRVAMAARRAAGAVDISARAMWAAFETAFPDRAALAHATGWSLETIAEIDDYRDSPLSKSFPTAAELEQAIPGGRLVPCGDYPLAERSPLFVIDFS